MTRQLPNTRADYRNFSMLTTRWTDNDVYSHMNNAIHYQLFDTAVNGFLIAEHILDFRNTQTVFLVVETGCVYFSEIAFPDVVYAGIRIRKLGGSSIRYEVGLFRNDSETAAAQGYFVHVNVDRETRRPVKIDDAARAILHPLLVETGRDESSTH